MRSAVLKYGRDVGTVLLAGRGMPLSGNAFTGLLEGRHSRQPPLPNFRRGQTSPGAMHALRHIGDRVTRCNNLS